MENFPIETPGTINRIKERFNKNYFETLAWQKGQLICGLDEVGRGCLAGPVVTAAVILPPGKISRHLKDSKVMAPQERLAAFEWIEKNCWYSFGIAHHRLVDEHNVWHATLIAMKKALVHLLATAPHKPCQVITDAMPLNLGDTAYRDIPVYYFPFGERRSSTIAAASIVAKVKRDSLMQRMDTLFPGYFLANHKGYGTPTHKKIITENKTSLIIHRASYLSTIYHNLDILSDSEKQSTFMIPSQTSLNKVSL